MPMDNSISMRTEHRLSYSEVQPLHNKQPCSTLSTVPFYLSSPPPRLFFLFDTFVLLLSLSPLVQVETFKFARCLLHQRKRSSCAFCRINRVLSRSGWKLGGQHHRFIHSFPFMRVMIFIYIYIYINTVTDGYIETTQKVPPNSKRKDLWLLVVCSSTYSARTKSATKSTKCETLCEKAQCSTPTPKKAKRHPSREVR